ncbi:hypothetical protein [Streptomyces sp. NPDC057302]
MLVALTGWVMKPPVVVADAAGTHARLRSALSERTVVVRMSRDVGATGR